MRGWPREGILAAMANIAARRHMQGDTAVDVNPRTFGQNDLENTNSRFAIGHHGYRLSMLEMFSSIKRFQQQASALRTKGLVFHMLQRRTRAYQELNRADAEEQVEEGQKDAGSRMNDQSQIPPPFGKRDRPLSRTESKVERTKSSNSGGQRQIAGSKGKRKF